MLAIAIPLVAFALAAVTMLVKLQVTDPDRYRAEGENQRTADITMLGLRGSILDRNGEALALSVAAKAIAADPRHVDDPRRAAVAIAPILGLSIDALEQDLGRPDTGFVFLARGVDPDLAARVKAIVDDEGLAGISIIDEEQRVDPGDGLARSVIGQPASDADASSGFGLEKLLDSHLRGTAGRRKVEFGHTGDRSVIVGTDEVLTEPRRGADVTLTLDRPLQFFAEKLLGEQLVSLGAKAGTVVLGRPQTGEILGMASMYTEDGQAFQSQLNLATRSYEPGSVMKMVTAAGAFEDGLVQPETTFTVADSIRLYDKTIRDSHSHKVKTMTVNHIISESSNVGTIQIAQKLGKERILHYLDAFGFGSMTNLGLPKEQSGVVRTDWSGTDIGSIPIGQSITVTPLQMWAAYNVIANDGVYVAPRLITDIVDPDGHHLTPDTPAARRVISSSSAQKVNGALREVVEEGTGKELKIPGYTIAAKTGTAYKPLPGGGYIRNGERSYASSFVGFFPATNPQLSIMVMIDEPPLGRQFGAVAAGPVFDRLARLAMKRFGIPGDVAVDGEGRGPARANAAPPLEPAPEPLVTDVPSDPAGPDGVAPDPAAAQAMTAGSVPPPTEAPAEQARAPAAAPRDG